jgi:hypothetical protein
VKEADEYRAQAEKMRQYASTTTDQTLKESFLKLAEEYEVMARHAEARR